MKNRKPDRPKKQEPGPQEINTLVALFTQGRYAEATTLAETMTVRYPHHGFGWSILGAVLKQLGRNVDALAAMRTAVALSPNVVESHYNLGLTLQDLGRLEEAEACYRRAVEIMPDYAPAHYNLGNCLRNMGRLEEALACYERATQSNPGDAAAQNNLGMTLNDLGRLDEAETCYRRALEISPNFAEAYNNLGNNLKRQGAPDEAEVCYRKALAMKPDYANALTNLGLMLQDQGRLKEAEECFRCLVRINPDDEDAHNYLGLTLHDLGRLDEAVACYRGALQFRPDYPALHNNLGNSLYLLNRYVEAEACFRRVLEIQPDYAAAYSNLGINLQALHRLDEAEASFRRALEIQPDYAKAYTNLGVTLQSLGRFKESVDSFRRAMELKPDDVATHSNLLFGLNYHPDLRNEDILSAHLEYDARVGTPLWATWPRHANSPESGRRLKIGYVSPDMRQHSVAYFLEALLRTHDHSEVEVYCYAELTRPDAVTVTLQGYADHWLGTVGLSDAALAERIMADRIDILVDLAGHTAHNRLPVFARKPAPVQITWLGYPNTTGLAAMDYRLVDAVTDPPGEADRWASETLIRLEDGFLCYDPPADAPPPVPPPSHASGGVTFGSFNNPAKLSSATLDVWAKLLERVPGSRLLAKGKAFADSAARAAFLTRLTQRGVDPGRVTLLGFVSGQADHLAVYEQIDIGLDPFPYNGTTTTCEALWMGVPVVTLRGDRHAGRVGASLLTRVGLTELIAPSVEAYIDIAAALAVDPARLAALRQSMRERMRTSPLCDAPAFARKIEATFQDLWRRYCVASN